MDFLIQIYVAFEVWTKDKFDKIFKKEDGAVDIIAIVVLIAIAVALAIVFREQIKGLFDTLWGTISGNATGAVNSY